MPPMSSRDEQLSFCLRVFVCGLGFLLGGLLFPGAMTPEQFGWMAYDIDAEVWGFGFMSSAGLAAYGIHINGRWRWSPALRIAGYLMLLVLFGILAASGLGAKYGFQTVIYAVAFFGAGIAGYLVDNVSDLRKRIAHGAG